MKKKIVLISLLLLGVGSFVFLPIVQAREMRLKWGASSVRSSGYAQVILYAKAVHQAFPGEISITVVETGGWVENLSRLRLHLLHLGQVNPISAYTVFQGLYDFKDQKNPDIRMLFASCIMPNTFVVGKDTRVTTIEGLNGLKMASNPASTSERLGRMFLESNGIKPDYKWGGTASNLEAMKAKTVDAWLRTGFRDGAITELALSRPLNFVSITQEHLKKFNERYPAHGQGLLSPAGQYHGQDKPYYTLAFGGGEMVDKNVSADVVYKIVKAIWERRMGIVKVDATFREGGFADFPKLTMEYVESPLHPGAVKFYQELGLKIPDKLLPPK